MKIDRAPALTQFLKSPPADIIGALLFGPDAGLARERAEQIGRVIVPDLTDPFNVSELTGESVGADSARLLDEMSAQSLMGGRRLVRVRDAGDVMAPALQSLLESARTGDSFLLLEAGDLKGSSALRKLAESHARLAAIPCYIAEAKDVAAWCAEQLRAHGVTASPEALALLSTSLADDRGVARQEVEKLITYAGESKALDMEDVDAATGDSAEAAFDGPAWAVADGNAALLDKQLNKLWAEGTSPVPVLRAAARHLTRLLEAVNDPAPPAVAIKNLKPPVFWKEEKRFLRQMERWRSARLAGALTRLFEAELQCKRSTFRDTTMATRALMALVK
jgi:DNA polymerase-3 subunit delta